VAAQVDPIVAACSSPASSGTNVLILANYGRIDPFPLGPVFFEDLLIVSTLTYQYGECITHIPSYLLHAPHELDVHLGEVLLKVAEVKGVAAMVSNCSW
jgi:hypothetical protein